MSDRYILEDNLLREKAVFNSICDCIKNEESWYFDAGAGAGKTYALIQTIKYIISQKNKILKKHNQKVLCITYTNVATNEIKERLGSTSLIEVSTIHDCVWEIIAPYQEQLVKIHEQKLHAEIKKIETGLNNEAWAVTYRNLSSDKKNTLFQTMFSRKNDYYKLKNSNVSEFRTAFPEINSISDVLLNNVGNFKKIISALFKYDNYKEALNKIQEKHSKFLKVKYDARYNTDKLEKMRISHDTLLEYTHDIIKENNLLKQIICDKYPIILVDEYQDTNPLVIESISLIEKHSKTINHPFIIGYYGDVKQNIYESGVGSKFNRIHNNIKRIEKIFNRRSSPQVIDVANKIRNDALTQESIYTDFQLGEISFYNLNIDRQNIVEFYINQWNITENNKLHCLELTNEKVAEQSGFITFYNFFKKSNWYGQGINYKLLSDHLMSLDEKKLGIIQKIIFRILDFKVKISKDSTMLINIFSKKYFNEINIVDLRKSLEKLQNIQGDTLAEYLTNIFNLYKKGDLRYDLCIEYIIAEEINSLDGFKQFILNQLYYFSDEEYSDEAMTQFETDVEEFLNIDLKILNLWYSFVTDTCQGEVVYHTYHGTKGCEYENVIIFMNSDFGKKPQYFKNLLKVLSVKDETNEIGTDIESARNLLYVAVTRAIRNLCVVYFDDITGAETSITEVFGDIKYNLNQ